MARTEIKVKLEQNPLNGQSFLYRIKKGNSPVQFSDSNGDLDNKIKKTFIKKGQLPLKRFGMMDSNGVLDDFFYNDNIQFNGDVVDIAYIPSKGIRREMIAIIGNFKQFIQGGISYLSNGFIILEINLDEEDPAERFNIKFNYTGISSPGFKTIDYDSELDELAIGGDIKEVRVDSTTLVVDCIVFFDVGINNFNTDKTSRIIDLGGLTGNNKSVEKVTYGPNSNLYVSGVFSSIMGFSSSGLGVISPIGSPVTPFMNNFWTNGRILSHSVSNSGDVFIVGNFSVINQTSKVGLAKLNSNGILNNLFNTSSAGFGGGSPVDIEVKTRNNGEDFIFIGGTFNKFQGIDTGSIFKVDNNGNIDSSFSTYGTSLSNISVNKLNIYFGEGLTGDGDLKFSGLFVSGSTPNESDVNGYVLDFNANVKYRLYVNNKVNNFFRANNRILFGGNFTMYDTTNMILSNQEVAVGANISQTLQNLLTNYQNESIESNSIYSVSGDELVHKYYYFSSDVDVYNIREVEDYIKITVTDYEDGGTPINPLSTLSPILVRSDYIHKSAPGDFSYSRFTINTYRGNYSNVGDSDHVEVQKDLLEGQDNTFLNISRLIDKRNLVLGDIISYIKNSRSNSLKLFPTTQGKFGSITAGNYINNNNIGERNKRVFILNGFKDSIEEISIVPPVLINGDYREVVGDNIIIPINMSRINSVYINNVSFPLSSVDGYISDLRNQDGYLNYLNIDLSLYGRYTNISFYNNLNKLYELNIRKRDGNCNSGNVEVFFENRWGHIEVTHLTGRLKNSYKTDSKDYYTSSYDINGDISTYNRQNKIFNRNSQKEFECNTGIISSKMNDMYVDLVHSENIWINYEGKVYLVNIDDHNFRESYDDLLKPVNYSFKFKEASKYIK